MKIIVCKNCSGSDLVPVPGMQGVYKCAFCGTIYQMDETKSSSNSTQPSYPEYLSNKKHLSLFVAGFIVLVSFIVLGFFLFKGESSNSNNTVKYVKPNNSSEKPPKVDTTKMVKAEEKDPDVQITGEYSFMNSFDAYGGSLYYICIYKNTSSVIIDKPKVQITYYDENDEPIDTVSGYGFKAHLDPGDSTGLLIISKKRNKLARAVIEHFPAEPIYIPKEIKLQLSGVKLRKGDYGNPQLIGTVENIDEFPGKYVSINGVLLKEKKAIAINSTFIHQKILKPGEKSVFKIDFVISADKNPDEYFIETSSRIAD